MKLKKLHLIAASQRAVKQTRHLEPAKQGGEFLSKSEGWRKWGISLPGSHRSWHIISDSKGERETTIALVVSGISGSFWSSAESACISINLGTSKRIRQHLWWRRKARHQLGGFPACCVRNVETQRLRFSFNSVAKLALGLYNSSAFNIVWSISTMDSANVAWLPPSCTVPVPASRMTGVKKPTASSALHTSLLRTNENQMSACTKISPCSACYLCPLTAHWNTEDQRFYRFPQPLNPDAAGSSCYSWPRTMTTRAKMIKNNLK